MAQAGLDACFAIDAHHRGRVDPDRVEAEDRGGLTAGHRQYRTRWRLRRLGQPAAQQRVGRMDLARPGQPRLAQKLGHRGPSPGAIGISGHAHLVTAEPFRLGLAQEGKQAAVQSGQEFRAPSVLPPGVQHVGGPPGRRKRVERGLGRRTAPGRGGRGDGNQEPAPIADRALPDLAARPLHEAHRGSRPLDVDADTADHPMAPGTRRRGGAGAPAFVAAAPLPAATPSSPVASAGTSAPRSAPVSRKEVSRLRSGSGGAAGCG